MFLIYLSPSRIYCPYVCVWHRDATLRRVATAFVDSTGVVHVPSIFTFKIKKSWWGRKKKKKKTDFSPSHFVQH
jgi:hypothetical protein